MYYGPGGGMYWGPGPAPKDGPKPGKDKDGKKGKDGKGEEGAVSAPATILVNLPANAKLFVDGAATTSTSASRVLVTPALPADQQFTYNLKAETVINGQTVVQQQQVTVQGGQQTPVSFKFDTQGVAVNNE
jgi:uncharacterized protein (TIGR03000 family)